MSFSPPEALLNRLMLLFSAQYHTLCFYLSHWRTAAQQRTLADPALVERNETEPEEPAGGEKSLSFRLARRSARKSGAKGPFHVHKSCTHIYLTYISLSTHPAVMFGKKRKDNSAKTRSCGGPAAAVLLSFLCPLRCLPNAVDLNEEKSLINPRPPHLPTSPVLQKSLIKSLKMQSLPSADRISEGAAYACACGLNYFFSSLSSCPAVGLFFDFFVCLFVQKGPFFPPSTYNKGEQTNR